MSSINHIVKKLRENRILAERKDYKKYSRDELIDLAQDGDQLAFETLIDTHKDFLRRMTSKYFLVTGDQDDLMQIASIGFWEAVDSWNKKGDFEAYAGMIIKRRIAGELDKESAEKSKINTDAASTDDVINDDGEGGQQTLGDIIPSDSDAPDDVAVAHEVQSAIAKYLADNYTIEERKVLQMYIDGYTKKKDIAEELGMKYKQVDNILYKIKFHLKEYLKQFYNESKKVRESSDIEFSDEEKRLLKRALKDIQKQEVREASRVSLESEYEQYSESQIEDELDEIEDKISEIAEALEDTTYDERDDLLDAVEDLRYKLVAMEDYVSDRQYKRWEEIMDKVHSADRIEYRGYVSDKDPYAERGLRRSEF